MRYRHYINVRIIHNKRYQYELQRKGRYKCNTAGQNCI